MYYILDMKQAFTNWQPTKSYKLTLTGDPARPQKTVRMWKRAIFSDNGCIIGKRELIGIQYEWRDLPLIDSLSA